MFSIINTQGFLLCKMTKPESQLDSYSKENPLFLSSFPCTSVRALYRVEAAATVDPVVHLQATPHKQGQVNQTTWSVLRDADGDT